jgi:hypothetical protein
MGFGRDRLSPIRGRSFGYPAMVEGAVGNTATKMRATGRGVRRPIE